MSKPKNRIKPAGSGKSRTTWVGLCFAGLVSGCAATGKLNDQQSLATVPQEVSADPYYQILLAELAKQHGNADVASQAYSKSLELFDDKDLAKEAYRFAARHEQDELAQSAAKRWAEASTDPQASVAMASEALKLNQLDEAVKYFARYLHNTEDGRGEGFPLIAAGLSQKKYLPMAQQVVLQLTRQFPQRPAGQVAVAQIAYQNDDIATAIKALDRGLALNPDMEEAQLFRAQLLLQQGQGEKALVDLRNAVEGIPESLPLRRIYAQQLLHYSKNDEAREQFRQLLLRDSADTKALYALAALELERGNMRDAKRHYISLLAIDGERDTASYYLGRIAEHEHNDIEAHDWYQRVGGGKRLFDAQRRIIAITLRRKGPQAAADYAHEARLLWPQYSESIYELEAGVWNSVNQPDKSLATYNNALQELPDSEPLRYARAVEFLKMKDLAAAEKDLRLIIQQDADNDRALNALGYALLELSERYTEADELIRRAYRLVPDSPEVLDSMGWAAFKLGNLKTAEQYLRQAFEHSPDPEIAAHLGEVLWHSNRQQASEIWNRGLKEGDPSRRYHVLDTMRRLAPELLN